MNRAFVVFLLLAFGVLIWPTRYRDGTVYLNGTAYSSRTDRLTGQVEVFSRNGWRALGAPASRTTAGPTGPASPCPSPNPDRFFGDIGC